MLCDNWPSVKENMRKWWRGEPIGRPLMRIIAKRNQPIGDPDPMPSSVSLEDKYLSPIWRDAQMRNFCKTHRFMADAFPAVDLNLGAGSIAVYLGCKPIFRPDTVWFEAFVENPEDFDIRFDPENSWLIRHLEVFKQAQKLAAGDYLVNLPDLVENIDILSAMRGPQNLCYDLMDQPEQIKKEIDRMNDIYFDYYDRFYNIIKGGDGSSSYTAFAIWAPGKVAKVQCDFSAMMSAEMYREFVLPAMKRQCEKLDYSLYHLDGPGALQHADALMEIKALHALQWTPGAGNPDGGSEQWYPLYEKVRAAGKSLWISIDDGEYEDWVKKADKLIHTFGSTGIYLLFPEMTEEQATRLLIHAEDCWNLHQ